jgi:hypothetical protein
MPYFRGCEVRVTALNWDLEMKTEGQFRMHIETWPNIVGQLSIHIQELSSRFRPP